MASESRSARRHSLLIPLVAAAALLTIGAVWGASRFLRRQNIGQHPIDLDNKKRRRSTPDLTEAQKRQRPVPEDSPPIELHGSVPDMRASWSAKLMVTDAEQADADKLGDRYDGMASNFHRQGLNIDAVKAQRQYYGSSRENPHPLDYKDFPVPLEEGAVRLGIFLLADSPQLHFLVRQAMREVMGVLPPDMMPCQVDPANFHMTIFMTSQPSDPRPDVFVKGGGIDRSVPLSTIPAPDEQTLQKETDAWRDLASASSPPEFQVHSVLFASSGTLLLCLVDTSGRLLQLRQHARAKFPGAAEKQSSIMHVTLGRVLQGRQMDADETDALQSMCKQWTARLRGQRFIPSYLWFVQEYTFTTVEGKRQALDFQKSS